MKKKNVLAVLICLLVANLSFAGNVKVIDTEVVDVTYDMNSNLYVQMNVRIEMANIGKEECGVMMIMDNQRWPGRMTFEEFANLINSRCYGEAFLPVTGAARTRRTIRVTVPLDANKLTGEGETFYAKTFVFNLKSESCVGEGEPIQFEINFNAIKQRMVNDAVDIVGGALLFGTLFW